MRGGLDDALEKLARRDELRRRAANEATGTPAAVTELVEAIAAVVGRHPRLGVTVGVEGDGDPVLLRFYYEDGQVQVTAENNLPAQPHADFDVEVGEPVDDFTQPAYPSHDDQDRFGPVYGYEHSGAHQQPGAPGGPQPGGPQPGGPQPGAQQPGAQQGGAQQGGAHQQPAAHFGGGDTVERHYGAFEQPPATYAASQSQPQSTSPEFPSAEFVSPEFPAGDFASPGVGESSRDLGARMRDLGMASSRETPVEFPPHPLAPTPPPTIPPQTTRRLGPEHYRPTFGPAANDRAGATERLVPPPPPEQRVMPTPLPEPIPLKVERPEETEMAARRLAALLRDDPTLLSQRPD